MDGAAELADATDGWSDVLSAADAERKRQRSIDEHTEPD
jgi:hypothetical protein